ncbi:hypothetical protein ACFL12_04400 [Pseudomonadota bacterium]
MRRIQTFLVAVLCLALPAAADAACSDGDIAEDTELLHGTSFVPLTDRLGHVSATPREPAWFADTTHREFAIHAGARWAAPTDTEMQVHHYTTKSDLAVRICEDRDEFISDQRASDSTFTFNAGNEDRDIARHFCGATTTFVGYQLNEDAVRDEPEYILCDPAGDLNVEAVDTLPLATMGNIITITDGPNEYELDKTTLDFTQTRP